LYSLLIGYFSEKAITRVSVAMFVRLLEDGWHPTVPGQATLEIVLSVL